MAPTLSARQVQEVSQKSKEDGKQLLLSFLGWPEFDEEEEPQRSIHLDCVYDCLAFLSKRGVAWCYITELLHLLLEILEEFTGKNLPDTVKLYYTKLHGVQDKLSEGAIKLFTDYFFSSLMRHFKLYQFVFTREREVLKTVQDLDVNVPIDPLPFPEGKDIKVYDYEQKYNALEVQLAEKQAEHAESALESQRTQRDRMQQGLEHLEQMEAPLERQKLVALINEIASSHVSAAVTDLRSEVDFTMGEVGLMLEKTALPRPAALGPPPRYKTKTPIPSSGKRQSNSRETIKSRQTPSKGGKK